MSGSYVDNYCRSPAGERIWGHAGLLIWGTSGAATDIGMGKLGEMNLKLTYLILHISAVS